MILIPRILLLAFVVGAAATLAACKYHEPNSVILGSGGGTGGGITGGSTGSSATVMDIKGQPVTFTTSAGSIQNLTSMPAPAFAPSAFTYPNGFFSYKITGLTPGATVTLTIALPAGTHPVTTIKCGTEACSQFAGATISGDVQTLTLTDGGAGDSDGLANGEISDDPEGAGFAIGGFPKASPSTSSLNFGNVHVGDRASLPFTLTNSGTADLDIIGIGGLGFSSFGVEGACVHVPPGLSCQLTVFFVATTTGTYQSFLHIDTNVGDIGINLSATGTYTAPFATSNDIGLSALQFPISGGCNPTPQGLTCTPVPGLQNVDSDAKNQLDLSQLTADGAATGGFFRVPSHVKLFTKQSFIFGTTSFFGRSGMTNTQAAKTKAATTPAPVQISSESQATGALCSEYVINTDYSNPLAALFFYQLPGADGNCFTADDIFRYTPLSADANTAPRSAPTLPFSGQRVEAFYDSTLKAVSFVAPVFFHNAPLNQPQNALLMYDAQLQNPRTIASDLQEGGRPLAQNLGGKLYHVFDRKSGKQLIVRVTAYGTVNTLQTLSNNDSPGGAGRSTDDGVNFYYFSGGALLRLAMDGSGPAVQIGTLPAGVTGFQVVGTTDQAVLVQGSLSDGSGKLYSVPKNPPTPPVAATMLDAIPAKSYLPFIVTQGANVYYTVQAVDNSLIKAVTAKDDGSSTTPMANARWAYYVVDNRTPAGLYDDRQVTDLILVHGFTNFQQTFDNGGTVTAVHLADNTTTDLTTLKYSTGVFLRFPDNGDPLGVGTIFQGTVNGGATDMFAFEIRASDPAARFAQITSTGANPGLIRDLRDLLSGAVNGAKRLINFE